MDHGPWTTTWQRHQSSVAFPPRPNDQHRARPQLAHAISNDCHVGNQLLGSMAHCQSRHGQKQRASFRVRQMAAQRHTQYTTQGTCKLVDTCWWGGRAWRETNPTTQVTILGGDVCALARQCFSSCSPCTWIRPPPVRDTHRSRLVDSMGTLLRVCSVPCMAASSGEQQQRPPSPSAELDWTGLVMWSVRFPRRATWLVSARLYSLICAMIHPCPVARARQARPRTTSPRVSRCSPALSCSRARGGCCSTPSLVRGLHLLPLNDLIDDAQRHSLSAIWSSADCCTLQEQRGWEMGICVLASARSAVEGSTASK